MALQYSWVGEIINWTMGFLNFPLLLLLVSSVFLPVTQKSISERLRDVSVSKMLLRGQRRLTIIEHAQVSSWQCHLTSLYNEMFLNDCTQNYSCFLWREERNEGWSRSQGGLSQYETESTAVVCVITADKHWHTELVTLPGCSPYFQD